MTCSQIDSIFQAGKLPLCPRWAQKEEIPGKKRAKKKERERETEEGER